MERHGSRDQHAAAARAVLAACACSACRRFCRRIRTGDQSAGQRMLRTTPWSLQSRARPCAASCKGASMIWKGKRNSGRFGNYNAMELGSYGRKRRCKLLMNESNMHMHDDSSNSCTDKLEQRTSSKKLAWRSPASTANS